MKTSSIFCLRGPNVWAACPVIEVALDLSDRSWSPAQCDQALRCLETALLQKRGSGPAGDGVPARLARAFGLAVLELQELAGNPVSFSAVQAARPGLYRVASEYAEEPVGQAAVQVALRLLAAAREGQPLALEADLARLRDIAYDQRLPVSTAAVYNGARARGIPAVRLNPEYTRFLRLGQGSKQRRSVAAEPDDVSGVARLASTDKYLAKHLLHAAGVPVPVGRLVTSPEEAWKVACELGLPVATKPPDCDLAIGVSLDLRTREQVEAGFRYASERGPEVLIERFAPGYEHRVLVVGERIAAVSRIDPPHVVGDGKTTVGELVERFNRDPRRGEKGSGAPLGRIQLDDVAHTVLASQGCTLASVPPPGLWVLLRRNPPYIENGGTLSDLTEQIHPTTAGHAIAAAQALKVSVAGLDVVVRDITRPLEEQGGVIVEINAGPGLWLHLAPWADSPRPVGDAIVATMFPPGQDGRIPVAAVVGDDSGTARTHLTALLASAGLRAGSVDAAEVCVAGRRWPGPAGTPQDRAHVLFQNTAVDVALLATSPRELARGGFGNDRCNVALVLDTTAPSADTGDEIGPKAGEFLLALQHALAPDGVFVLPAADVAARKALQLPAERVILIAAGEDASKAGDHLANGGRALRVQGDEVMLAQGTQTPEKLGKWPGGVAAGERMALLGTLAAALGLGLTVSSLRAYLGERGA